MILNLRKLSLLKKIVIFSSGLFCVFLVILGVLFFYKSPISSLPEKEKWDPKGSLYLSLAPNNGHDFGIYEYDINKNILNPYYISSGIVFTLKFNSSLTTDFLASLKEQNGNIQIMQVKGDTVEIKTQSSIKNKRHPLYSQPYNAIIYAGREENAGELGGNPDEFNVYIKRENEPEQKLTEGAIPRLTPDAKSVVVLRSDGLYKIDLADKSISRIWAVEPNSTDLNQQFSISPKGKYIAWSYPDGGKIDILEVSSWSPFTMGSIHTIEADAFWPIFSPDERYLAFEEVDWTNPPSNARLVIMNLSSYERRTVYSLKDFDQLSLFLDDWK